MDKLLQKLRQNMAELSLQGDDFTRQIWQMYATFEEFIDHQQSPGDGSPPRHSNQDAPPPPPAPSGGIGTNLPSLSRDAVSSPFARVSPTMSAVTATLSAPSTRRRSSPPVTNDDLALVSPRRSRRRRPRRLRRSVDNPLLDTISTIGGDSDEEQIPLHHHYHHHLQPHSPASCSRLHPETDSIGYAGSNSVDSGYKSACPTPDLPDLMYPEHRLEKRGSLVSLASSGSSGGSIAGSKPRIPMGTRVMTRGGGVPKSPGTGGCATPTRRAGSDGSYYEMEQLVALRQALLGSPSDNEGRTIGGTRYSPRVSPATLPLCLGTSQRDIHVSRRAASPASPERRPRSASTGSRCSPGTRGTRKAFQAGSPLLASTGSLPRATSPGRIPSLSPAGREDQRPPTAWSRHSSPGMSVPTRGGRRPPSPIVGVEQDRESELALLEREIDALLYGGRGNAAQYYDLDSGREFPCPFGSVQDSHSSSCRPAIASVRRLREEIPEVTTLLSANDESQSTSKSSAEKMCSLSQFTNTMSSGSKSLEPPDSVPSAPPVPLPSAPPSVPLPLAPQLSQPSAPQVSLASAPPSSSLNTFSFCSSEVAKCVLAMLDGFPSTSKEGLSGSSRVSNLLGTGALKELATAASTGKQKYRTTPYPRQENSDSCNSDCDGDSSCSSCSDYHLYEEILYGTSNKPPICTPKVPSPPPLPARPPLLLKTELEAKSRELRRVQAKPFLSNSFDGNFECCRCTCEFIHSQELQVKVDGCHPSQKEPATSSGVRLGTTVPSDPAGHPPPPPLRTTSQLTTQVVYNSHQRLPLSLLPNNSLTPSSTLTLNTTPQKHNAENPPVKPPRLKPVPPPRLISKPSETLSVLKENIVNERLMVPTNKNQTEKPVSQSSKPKQRNNLYSIFKDRHHRRFLSASLELEYNPENNKEKEVNNSTSLERCADLVKKDTGNCNLISSHSSTQNDPASCNPSLSSKLNVYNVHLESLKERISSSSESDGKDKVMSILRPKRTSRACLTAACSLDLSQSSPVDDDYGFQVLPRVV